MGEGSTEKCKKRSSSPATVSEMPPQAAGGESTGGHGAFEKWCLAVMAILRCQLNYKWNELQSSHRGHTCESFSACFEVGESTSSTDLWR